MLHPVPAASSVAGALAAEVDAGEALQELQQGETLESMEEEQVADVLVGRCVQVFWREPEGWHDAVIKG